MIEASPTCRVKPCYRHPQTWPRRSGSAACTLANPRVPISGDISQCNYGILWSQLHFQDLIQWNCTPYPATSEYTYIHTYIYTYYIYIHIYILYVYICVCIICRYILLCVCVSLHTYTYLVSNPKVAESTHRSRPGRSRPSKDSKARTNGWRGCSRTDLITVQPWDRPLWSSQPWCPAWNLNIKSKNSSKFINYSTIILKIYRIRILTCKLIAIYGLFNEFCS